MKRQEIIDFLNGRDDEWLFERARAARDETLGDKVYLRGLIELSNRCLKDCLYCGIRNSNHNIVRYELSENQVFSAAIYAVQHHYGSVVLQSGEQNSARFVDYIERLVSQIKELSFNQLNITLSLGEQPLESYKRWRAAGAHRYLLRIESSSQELYQKIHPEQQTYIQRITALQNLRDAGFKVGSGVMIGLPMQSVENLADDILFFRDHKIDMCGMGPYIEHPDTPLVAYRSNFSSNDRLQLTLRMIAVLRILMPWINIASTTALHALDPLGREKGVAAGANVVMPNITPQIEKNSYRLYANKPMEDMVLDNFNVAWGEDNN
ncbi:MAG: [FeFe] hydrogenase H-cluster radical SAM maturase HydE [Mucinivorans sp.]